jgi:putative transposase
MKGRKHTPAQIIEKLRVADIELANGANIAQVTAKLGVTEKTYYRTPSEGCSWRAQYGGMKAEEARRLKELEVENARLKRLVADLSLDVQVLKEVAKKPRQPNTAARHGDLGDAHIPAVRAASLPVA